MGTADVGHWTVRVGNYNLATRLFGKGTLEHGIPSHSLCVSGLVSESDECLPRFLCFGSPTMKSKALLHCNNNPSEASMIGKWLKYLIFPGSNGFVAWKAWNGCLGMIHNPLGACVYQAPVGGNMAEHSTQEEGSGTWKWPLKWSSELGVAVPRRSTEVPG